MKIVMAAAECIPFVKTGGLADVIGSLPKELVALGHNVTVVLPKYSLIPEQYTTGFSIETTLEVPFKGQSHSCNFHSCEFDGVHFVFVENDGYYARDQIYSQPDDAERFAFLNFAVLTYVQAQASRVDIIHAHDWHTAMIPFLMKEDIDYQDVKSIVTIHNLQFQGIFSKDVFTDNYGLADSYFEEGAVEWNDRFNMLKTGIQYADLITTVSPTYREEIMTEQFGEGLHALLKSRESDVVGILNGLDTEFYNPASDLTIEMEFDHTSVEGKAVNKRAIQTRFGLPERGDVPLLTMVSRLAGQKGIDVLEAELPAILEQEDVQFVLLGSGEQKYEQFIQRLSEDFPDKVNSCLGFDESLAHLLYAGADIFLMPSHFEPCGLSQLVSMRYGTVPVANRTGGLQDTIVEYDETLRSGNGFLSDFANQQSFTSALKRALELYPQSMHWETIKQNGMLGDYSWSRSAKEYDKMYKGLLENV